MRRHSSILKGEGGSVSDPEKGTVCAKALKPEKVSSLRNRKENNVMLHFKW